MQDFDWGFVWIWIWQGVVASGVGYLLLTYCVEKRGPVFVAAFVPVLQIIVSVMDFTVLHETLYLGRYVPRQHLPIPLAHLGQPDSEFGTPRDPAPSLPMVQLHSVHCPPMIDSTRHLTI